MTIKFNKENYKLVLDKIISDPEHWNQRSYHCGTSHCFAGWAQIISGKAINIKTTRQDARIFLGLTKSEADFLFSSHRNLEDFKYFLNSGYDLDGYDRDGYDRNGYDRNGYDRDDYDRDGYNRNGYNRYDYDDDNLDENNNPKPL